MPFDEPIECPLCMEPLDIDDLNFYPCTCGYQICRFCWHRIRTDENSLCPACRKQYQEDPAEFKPLTEEELTNIKKERRQKDVARKQKAAENRRHLANIRVVQKNLVFVVGLSNRLADQEVLKRQDYFGKYGKIIKVVINSSTSYAGAQVRQKGPSASAYITYTKPEDCLRAIHAVNNLHVDGRTLKASLGTTKYCSHFLKGTQCTKTDCMYLHELGDGEASFTKEEMQSGKHQEYEQKLVDTYLTPNTPHPPPVATQLSNPARSSATGDGTNGVSTSNRTTSTTQRKKTDSGSSGSGKQKEPWPLLNSNRNANQINNAATTSKDSGNGSGDPVIGVVDSPGSVTTSAKHNNNSQSHSSSQPTVSDNTVITSTEPTVVKQNGMNHSSPSSNSSSSSSNPRTPTPESSSSVSPRLSSAAAEERPPTAVTQQEQKLPTERISTPKTLLAVRKLPFSDSPSADQNDVSDVLAFQRNAPTAQANSYDDCIIGTSNATIEQMGAASLNSISGPPGFVAHSKSTNSGLPAATEKSATPPNWPTTTLDQTAFASDDDLGFDPFMESNKGLADMLENETSGFRMPSFAGYSTGLGLPMPHHRPPPGVATPAHLQHAANGPDMFSAGGILSSIAPPSSTMLPTVVSTNTSSTLPPPPPGLPAFPQFSHDGGVPSSTVNNIGFPDRPPYRGSRMMPLMGLGQNMAMTQAPSHSLQPPLKNVIPRSPYNDSRMGSMQSPMHSHAMPTYSNGMADMPNFNTQELRDSLKALLPNASINFGPNPQPQHIQHSRLRNNYMQQPGPAPHSNSLSWNGNVSQPQQMPGVSSSSLDDQFTDPAIVSGCLSTDNGNSPSATQPHWLKSIQQLTEMDSFPPMKLPQASTQPLHNTMPSMPSVYRQPATHSRMPFAQNLLMGQSGPNTGNWPSLQAHNPPPGFQSNFRSTTQNPHMATLES